MILQLKITLQDSEPLIWRRLLVDGDMTFDELDEILQIAFGWNGNHKHEFVVKRREGKKVDSMYIRNLYNDHSNADYNEFFEFLDDWLVEKKDWLIYCYDFGKNWEHKIELEDILEPVEEHTYPYCVKAVGGVPSENQRLEWMTGKLQVDDIPDDKLTMEINEALSDIASLFWDDEDIEGLSAEEELLEKLLDDGDYEGVEELIHSLIDDEDDGADNIFTDDIYSVTEEENDESIVHELLTTAKEFSKAKPWLSLDDDQIFMIMNREYDVEMYCSVLGANEETFGLAVYLGQEGYQSLVRLFNEEMTETNAFDQRCLFTAFNNRDELSKGEYEFIKDAGFTFRGKNQWPSFLSLTPGKMPWRMSDEEMEIMTIAMQQTLILIKELKQNSYEIESFLQTDKIVTREKQDEWITTVYVIDHEAAEELETASLLVSELDVKRLKKLKKHPTPIEIGAVVLHVPIADNADDRPIIPTFVAGIDSETGIVLFGELLADGSSEAIQQFLVQSLQKFGFCPTTVRLRKENLGIFEVLLKELECTIDIQQELPEFEQFLNAMYEDFFE